MRVSPRVVRGAEPFGVRLEIRSGTPEQAVGDCRQRHRGELHRGEGENRQTKPDREVSHAPELYPLEHTAFRQYRRGG